MKKEQIYTAELSPAIKEFKESYINQFKTIMDEFLNLRMESLQEKQIQDIIKSMPMKIKGLKVDVLNERLIFEFPLNQFTPETAQWFSDFEKKINKASHGDFIINSNDQVFFKYQYNWMVTHYSEKERDVFKKLLLIVRDREISCRKSIISFDIDAMNYLESTINIEVLTFILDICKEFDYVPRFSYCRPIEDEENTDYNLKTTVTLTPKTTEP